MSQRIIPWINSWSKGSNKLQRFFSVFKQEGTPYAREEVYAEYLDKHSEIKVELAYVKWREYADREEV